MNDAASSPEEPGSKPIWQAERTACRTIDDKAIVITIDNNQLHVLNLVGTRVWELADGRTIQQIVDVIAGEFAVETAQASLDVQRFVAQLLEIGALQLQAPRRDWRAAEAGEA